MTLFDIIAPDDIYSEVLNKFYHGERCSRTIQFILEDDK